MSTTDATAAKRLLNGLEQGSLSPHEAGLVAEDLDPVLVYAIVTYLREIHPAGDPAASGVLGRVVELSAKRPAVVKAVNEGQADPISAWFRSEYEFRDFRHRGDELIDLLVDKLES